MVGHPHDLRDDVTREDRGAAFLDGLLTHEIEQLATRDGVEAGRGFVEHEQVGPAREGQAQRELDLGAAGERLGALVDRDAEALEERAEPGVVPRRVQPTHEPPEAAGVHVRVQVLFLTDVADAALLQDPRPRHRLAEQLELAGVQCVQTQQRPQRGRLAGAVASEEAVDRPCWHRQIEAVEDDVGAIPFGGAA